MEVSHVKSRRGCKCRQTPASFWVFFFCAPTDHLLQNGGIMEMRGTNYCVQDGVCSFLSSVAGAALAWFLWGQIRIRLKWMKGKIDDLKSKILNFEKQALLVRKTKQKIWKTSIVNFENKIEHFKNKIENLSLQFWIYNAWIECWIKKLKAVLNLKINIVNFSKLLKNWKKLNWTFERKKEI